ncbi:DUF4224 domain-containing protein [Paraburkholderia sp. BCC1885]|jgi:hypothetical protein|uniref:DUF4224 domain-containing protein n=1 Tax=Paraburkholderia sp. BCC1885 TaxID=2562669 RepID=UPI0011822394
MFLSTQELVQLTGRKVKAKQIDALRCMGIAFFVRTDDATDVATSCDGWVIWVVVLRKI